MKINPILVNNINQLQKIKKSYNEPIAQISSGNSPDTVAISNPYPSAIAFEGLNTKGLVKQRGMMFHITNLPAEHSFCGQFLDPQTSRFIKWLSDAKQTHWIMNPLNALEDSLCPYSSDGRFSRNKFIVNLNKLTEKDYGHLLKTSELPEDISTPTFTFEMLNKQKNPRFEIAFNRFEKLPETAPIKKDYQFFLKDNDDLWLEDYANYSALSKIFGKDWVNNWDRRLQTAPEDAKKEGISTKEKILQVLPKIKPDFSPEEYNHNVELYKFEQFLYDKQFNEMKKELDEHNIRLILDLPIGVGAASADTWSKKNIFLLDKNFKPTKVSGAPPEEAYPYTQVWGHALYNYDSPDFWDYQEASVRQILKSSDLRLDHFVGYINRAELPFEWKTKDGRIIHHYDMFKPIEEGGVGTDFFKSEWITNISDKKSPKGENVFELFMRIARELGKRPEETFILENFGPLSQTEAYKKFDKEYGHKFMSQRVPIAMGISDVGGKINNLHSPFKIEKNPNVALLTGNHDLPTLKDYVDLLMDKKPNMTKTQKNAQKTFKKFCKEELKLTSDEMNDKEAVFENLIKWHYSRNAKQVQTTVADALGIYFRPNIPGSWNGMYDKYLMKTTPEALLSYWSRVFPRDFLDREDTIGITPGYKKPAEKFVELMNKMFGKE